MARQMRIGVTAEDGGASAALSAIGAAGQVRRILECVGQGVENEAVRSAMAKGGRSFWQEVARSVSHQMEGSSMVVGATHAAAGIKQTGGIIRAPGQGEGSLHRRALAIPVGLARQMRWDTDEAESAGFRLFRSGETLFGQPRGRKGRGKGGAAVPLFILRRSVRARPDPWFPTGNALAQAAADGLELFRASTGAFTP